MYNILLQEPQSPTRIYKILVVFDPTRVAKEPPNKDNVGVEWIQEDIPNGMSLLTDPALKGLIFQDFEEPADAASLARGCVGVWICDKVSD